jgi:hypothetical protein
MEMLSIHQLSQLSNCHSVVDEESDLSVSVFGRYWAHSSRGDTFLNTYALVELMTPQKAPGIPLQMFDPNADGCSLKKVHTFDQVRTEMLKYWPYVSSDVWTIRVRRP